MRRNVQARGRPGRHAGGMNAFLYVLVVLIWGTTWIALKWQLGSVPIALSIG